MSKLRITKIEVHEFQFEMHDVGKDYNGFNLVYEKGGLQTGTSYAMKVHTNEGVVGEYVGGDSPGFAEFNMFAGYLIGRDPTQRELIYNDVKRAMRKFDKMGMGSIDIALWDLAGKLYGAPVYEMLGGWRTSLTCYASTMHGDRNGGLDSPQAFADFALQCKEMGYPAFKIHGWVNGPTDREVAAVLAIRRAVGDDMDLLLDPAGCFPTFEDVLKVGRACDQARYMWYEDPFRGGGFSRFAHAKLRELIKTPMLMGEHVRGLEAKADTIHSGATDFVRANANADGGITGVMKIAALAEANGLDVELHGGGLAHRHIMSTLRNANYYELGLVHPLVRNTKVPIYAERRWLDELDSVDGQGCVEVPEGPGMGVDFDWDFIESHKSGETVYE